MNINPEIALREQSVLSEYLRQRGLVLAQMLADVTSERDQYKAELEALKKERAEENADGAAE